MMMFNRKELFTSGPHRLHIGGVSLRHVLHAQPGVGACVQLDPAGPAGRAIVQTGELRADTPRELRERITAITEQLDGRPHELCDPRGELLDDVVMLAFQTDPVRIINGSWRCHYRIHYVQLAQ